MSQELEQQFYLFFQEYKDNINRGGILLSTFWGSQDKFFSDFDYKDVSKGLKELQSEGFVVGNGKGPIEMISLSEMGLERFNIN